MIGQGGYSLLVQPVCHLFGFAPRQAVDDTGISGMFAANKIEQLLASVLFLRDSILNVGTVETADKLARLLQLQALDDFLAGALVGGCGQGDAWNLWKLFRQYPQLQVIAAEIMSPLGDAVGFINGKQGHP